MESKHKCHINISAPNLVNICVDESSDGEVSGRLYQCYDKEPSKFSNVVQLLRIMEAFFDSISFPQAATKARYFVEPEVTYEPKPEKITSQEKIIEHTGKKGTFVTYVQYRQNSTWQGEVTWMERGALRQFTSTLEFIKLIDSTLES